jgi:hypothetical protein
MQSLFYHLKKKEVYYLFIALLSGLALYPVLANGFWRFSDDEWILMNNPQVFTLDSKVILHYFTSFTEGQYAPINTLIYAVIYHFFLLSPFWYHFASLMVHIANTLLVFNLVLELAKLDQSDNWKANLFVAFITAVAFGIHPMQVETVVWVAASKTVFCTFLILLSLLMYVKWVNEQKIAFYVWAYVFFIASFGVKEQGVIIPPCLLLIDYLAKRRWLFKKLILEKLPFFITSFIFGILSLQGQVIYAGPEFFKSKYYPLGERLIFGCYSLVLYMGKITLPVDLTPFCPFPVAPGKTLPGWIWIFPVLVAALFCIILILIAKKQRLVVFSIAFFVVNLLLMLHIIPLARFGMMADRYVYISIIGYFMSLGTILTKIAWFHTQPKKVGVIIVVCFFVLGLSAHERARHWDNIVQEAEIKLASFWKKGGFN